MADSSEFGWNVVQEYVVNPLAEDSGDEKRIDRAFAVANRKVKADKKKHGGRFRPYPPAAQSQAPPASQAPANTRGSRPGVCYNCHKPGHRAFECLEEQKKADGKKLSTFDSFDCLSDCQYTAKNLLYTNKSSEHSDHTVSRSSYSEVCDHGSGNGSGNGSLDKCMSPVGRLKSAVNK